MRNLAAAGPKNLAAACSIEGERKMQDSKDRVTQMLNDAMDSILFTTLKLKACLKDSDEQSLKDGFRNFLVGWLQKVVNDKNPEFTRRRLRLHAAFLLEQCAEALHDLLEAEDITNFDSLMKIVDKAHDFTANMVNDSPEKFVRKYDSMVREVSINDAHSQEEKDERKRIIQANFQDFVRMRKGNL